MNLNDLGSIASLALEFDNMNASGLPLMSPLDESSGGAKRGRRRPPGATAGTGSVRVVNAAPVVTTSELASKNLQAIAQQRLDDNCQE